MTRCTKRDGGGMGCLREAGHKGMCKVRSLRLAEPPVGATPVTPSDPFNAPPPRITPKAESGALPDADSRIGAITEFATMMSMDRTEHEGGFLFGYAGNPNRVYLTPGGRLRKARVTIEILPA